MLHCSSLGIVHVVFPFLSPQGHSGSMKNDGLFVSSRAVKISIAVPFGIQSGAIVQVGNGNGWRFQLDEARCRSGTSRSPASSFDS